MSRPPLVSIVTVTFNCEEFLQSTIESIIKQSFEDWELIISDDHSTDGTWGIVESYSDGRIKKHRNAYNLGEYPNRNKAISLARGKYLIFIDGEDLLYSYALEIMVSLAEKSQGVGMVLARPWDERIVYPFVISPRDFYRFQYLDRGIAALNFTKILFTTKALVDSGGFDNPKIRMGDLYIQYKLAGECPCLIIPDGFTWWRRRKGQASEKLLNNQALFFQDSLQFIIPSLKKHLHFFSEKEQDQAYANLYGDYSRFLIRQILRLRIESAWALFRKYPVPSRFFTSILKRPVRNFFDKFSGDHPLQ